MWRKITSVPKNVIVRLVEEMYRRRLDIAIFIGYGVQRRISGSDIV